jgi:hypothetical protein
MMEWWNIGMMGLKGFSSLLCFTAFQYSIIPLFPDGAWNGANK